MERLSVSGSNDLDRVLAVGFLLVFRKGRTGHPKEGACFGEGAGALGEVTWHAADRST